MRVRDTIQFTSGRRASLVIVPADADPAEVVAGLGLPQPGGVIIVIGGTASLEPDCAERVGALLGGGVVAVAVQEGLTMVTGATRAGVFEVLGHALGASPPSAPVLGVAPAGLVTWPGRATAPGADQLDIAPLEPHHTHFALVGGSAWGVETPLLLALAAELGRRAPVLAVLASGGQIARSEVSGLVRAGRRVVTLAGSGRLADDLAWAHAGDGADHELLELAQSGLVDVVEPGQTPSDLVRIVRRAMERF